MTRLSLRSLAARPLRTALTTLAIVLGVALIAGSLTLTDTQRKGADALSSSAYDGTAAVVSAKTSFAIDSSSDWNVQRPTIPASQLNTVRATPGVGTAIGDITDQNTKIFAKDGKPIGDGPYFGIGLDSRTRGFEKLTPFHLSAGRWAGGPGEVVLDQKTGEKKGFPVGSTVKIAGRGQTTSFKVVGLAKFGSVKSLGVATAAIFDLPTAQTFLHKPGAYDSILVAARPGTSAAQVRKALAGSVGPKTQVQTAAKHDRFTLDGLKSFIKIIRAILLAFGFIAVLVGGLTIINSLSIIVAQRSKEIGLLRLVGASRRQVLGNVLLEALVIGLLGSAAGVVVGYGIGKGMQSLFAAIGMDLPDAGTVFASSTILVSMIVGTTVTVIAGFIPAVRATRVAPIEALRDAEGGRKVGLVGRAITPVISLLGGPAARVGGVSGVLARRNAMRKPGRTLGTAGALTVGVALVTVVAIIAAGLKDTTKGSLERRIHAGYVVTAQDGWSPTDPAVAATLRKVDGVKSVTTVKADTALAYRDHEQIQSFDGNDISFDYKQGSTQPGSLRHGEAIVDDGWAKEHHLNLGSPFAITSPAGKRVALHVSAIEKSPVVNALAFGPVTISRADYDGAFKNDLSVMTAVDASASKDALQQSVKRAYPDADVQSRSEFIDSSMKDIDTMLAILVVLLALAVGVSLFGIANALVLAMFERRRELGMLQAVGMTRRQIRRMVRHESIVTALLGAVTGIGFGMVLGRVATALLSDEGLTFKVPTGMLVAIALVAVIAGMVAAILPARRAARLSPLSALAYE
jgi:putative ABC transport system permease protein